MIAGVQNAPRSPSLQDLKKRLRMTKRGEPSFPFFFFAMLNAARSATNHRFFAHSHSPQRPTAYARKNTTGLEISSTGMTSNALVLLVFVFKWNGSAAFISAGDFHRCNRLFDPGSLLVLCQQQQIPRSPTALTPVSRFLSCDMAGLD